ncbi:Tryptophan synthase alpha chain [Legionella massiliensis]|uniref:Tryptophan synthase alpha chain n=1 Tax=Legionella massiliensis TaxID=1034943 RepID=A0A078KXI6_9GAMM|nr:tryptophan synthase subunit alpha [Legionella massiliensis]CDZ79125.1 Tryptophan synthase alpha chain [Legionella massiliensis]CEE14863.1 Tryptophan synthase alpha chain [Legionella massiliensis]
MNRIDKTLAQLKASNKKMLSPYITAGDPKPELTVALMHGLVAAGANILEIGIPFSDPMAEGPVIQAAMERALKYDVSCDDVLTMIKTFREKDKDTPVILMGYVNPIEQYGYEEFAKRANEVGVDGTILVDLPPEESESVAPIWKAQNLHSIYLCSPTTTDERMAMIDNYGNGYLYYVSLKGVTGSSDFELAKVEESYLYRKSQTRLPLMVGFGIKTAAMAASVANFADGVIVGAALVNQVFEAYSASGDPIAAGASLIGEMRLAMDKDGKNHD